MGLLNRLLDPFRPRWRHSDADVRAEAVRELDKQDLPILQKIAQHDADARVRRLAMRRIDDPQVLLHIADRDPEEALRKVAAERAEELLLKDALGKDGEAAAASALSLLSRPRAIAEVARRAHFAAVRKTALARLTDQRLLADVAKGAEDAELRLAAVAGITDAQVLRDVAHGAPKEAGLAAVARLDDRAALTEIAVSGKNKAVRSAARERLGPAGSGQAQKAAAPEAGAGAKPAKQKIHVQIRTTPAEAALATRRRVQLQSLCQKIESSVSADLQRALSDMAAARATLAELGHEPGDEPLRARLQRAFDQIEARQKAAERKGREKAAAETAAAQATAREREEDAARVALCERVEALRTPQDGAGPGIPATLEELRAAWAALPPPEALPAARKAELDRRFGLGVKDAMRRHEQALATRARRAELESLCAQVERLREADPEEQGLGRKVGALVKRWREESGGLPEGDPLLGRFEAAQQAIEARLREVQERRQAEESGRVAALSAFIDKMAALLEGGERKRIEAILKEAKEAQGKLGQLPPPQRGPLRERFAEIQGRLMVRLKELRDEEDWKRWSNLPKLEALCAEVEALAGMEDTRSIGKALQAARELWKEIGPAPREKADALWERFQKAMNAARDRMEAGKAVAEEARAENLKKKEALCERAEALAESTEWREASEDLKALQAEWKAVGPVPKEQSDAIWKRFRTACDRFFARKKEHDSAASEERQANAARLEALCLRAEMLARSTEWKDTAEALKALQAEWKAVGHAGREQNEVLWKRFRAACDQFFEARKAHFDQLDVERAANLAQKEAICAQVEALLAQEEIGEQEAVEHVRRFSAAWKAVGPVPKEQSDAIWARFRDLCDRLLLRRWEPPEPAEGEAARFSNKLPAGSLKDIAERLGLSTSAGAGGEGTGPGQGQGQG
jgi:hypothetical protein